LAVKTWLLDANTLVYVMNNLGGVRDRANAAALTGRLVTSAIVVSELLYGAERSTRVEINRREIYATVSRITILPFDLAAAEQLARLRAHFEGAGRRRPRIDLMIAAQAAAATATLVSHDDDLLGQPIPGIDVEDWYTPPKA
jgi:tRNA(fMet)-specific endonuclease VapC